MFRKQGQPEKILGAVEKKSVKDKKKKKAKKEVEPKIKTYEV